MRVEEMNFQEIVTHINSQWYGIDVIPVFIRFCELSDTMNKRIIRLEEDVNKLRSGLRKEKNLEVQIDKMKKLTRFAEDNESLVKLTPEEKLDMVARWVEFLVQVETLPPVFGTLTPVNNGGWFIFDNPINFASLIDFKTFMVNIYFKQEIPLRMEI